MLIKLLKTGQSLGHNSFTKSISLTSVSNQRLVSTRSVGNPQGLMMEKKSYFRPSDTIKRVKQSHSERKDLPDENAKVSLGGRIIGRRKASSSLLFVDLESNGDTVQLMFDQTKVKENQQIKAIAQTCQRGAFIGVSGFPGRTAAGEFTIVAEQMTFLGGCDKNLPMMNWNHKKTLKDKETRFQKRYLDLIVNNELKQFFFTRSKIVNFLRQYLEERDFLEVETQILNA